MPNAHLKPLENDEFVKSLETGKARIQDFAFFRDFAFVMTESKDFSRERYNFRCQRHDSNLTCLIDRINLSAFRLDVSRSQIVFTSIIDLRSMSMKHHDGVYYNGKNITRRQGT